MHSAQHPAGRLRLRAVAITAVLLTGILTTTPSDAADRHSQHGPSS